MSDRAVWDAAQLRQLETDLATVGHQAHDQARAIVTKAAVNVKKDWRENAKHSAGKHAPAYPYSITFDEPKTAGGQISIEVGPDKAKRQGALGNLIEFGSANNPPHNDGGRALDAEEPRLASFAEKLAADLLRRSAGRG